MEAHHPFAALPAVGWVFTAVLSAPVVVSYAPGRGADPPGASAGTQ